MSKPSLRSRMGAAVRRSTSAFSIARPGTPSRSSSEIGSARPSLDKPHPLSDPDNVVHPSPIVESPVVGLPTAGPNAAPASPSAGDKAVAAEYTSPAPTPAPGALNDPVYEQQASVPVPASAPVEQQEEAPAPDAESAPVLSQPSGPGMFTDEPEEMSVNSVDGGHGKTEEHDRDDPSKFNDSAIHLTDAPLVDEPQDEAAFVAPPPPPTGVTTRAAPGAFVDDLSEPTPAAAEHSMPTPDSAIVILPEETALPQADVDASKDAAAPSYFGMPEPEVAPTVEIPVQFQRGLEENVWGYTAPSNASSDPTPRPTTTGHIVVVSGMPVPGGKKMDEDRISMFSFGDGAAPAPDTVNMLRNRMSKDTLTGEEEHDKGKDVEDPFADPRYPSTFISHSHVADPVMSMPVPNGVQPAHSLNMPSTNTVNQDHDETRPLLPRPHTPTMYTQPHANGSAHASSSQLIKKYGWVEYILPDGFAYFVQPSLRVTTDINLHSTSKMHSVMDFLDVTSGSKVPSSSDTVIAQAQDGRELWIRDAAVTKHETSLVKNWVDHGKRRVTLHTPCEGDDDVIGNEDRLDMEYRYWTYVESHPAHFAIPLSARNEALEALTWSYTDSLLPTSSRAPSPPFSSEECNQLMGLLRSFGEPSNELGPQTTLHTRIVSKILVRLAQWRQMYFRPDKSLPVDTAPAHPKPERRFPFRRALADFFISCFCFGIPYIFFERSNRRLDVESGSLPFRNSAAGPVLVFGACTCLVAAIILSASVTFLSLPGLDDFARIATIVSIVFSAGSMASSVIALVRYKADMERAMLITSLGEGMMFEYRRGIIMSLPMVFLIYSVIGFVVGLLFYSFKGTDSSIPHAIIRPFEEHTRWTAVGALGGVSFVLVMSLILNRK